MAIDEFDINRLSFADSYWQRYENWTDYGIFTSGVYKANNPIRGFSQKKPHIATLPCAERK
jgi:hypothetical protein